MTKRTKRSPVGCWCRCVCHPGICAKRTTAGRCGPCRRDCNEPKPEDRPR